MDNRTLEEVRKNETKLTKLIEEIKSLEKQLEYLRSGEYYNQLRFENEMLQQVVDTNGVPSEVYDYIDCTHRNTELLEENQELKKQLEEYKATNKILSHELTKDKVLQQDCLTTCCGIPIGDIPKLIIQQKEFISYLENEKDRLARECSHIYENSLGKTRLVNEDIFNEVDTILSKYKEIKGDDK